MDLRTGPAYWPLKSGLISVYPALEQDETCDVAVLGAGITGALAASRLATAGCDVVVLDGNDVAMGSTAGSTGLLQYETDTPLGQLISYIGADQAVLSWRAGLRAVDEIEQLCGSHCDFTRRPSLYLASRRADARKLRREYELRASHGFDVTWLERKEIARRYGFERDGAILSGGDAEVDPYQLTHRALAGATERGTRVYDRTHVDRIQPAANGITLETNRGATVKARRLVIAAGYEVARHLKRDRGHLHSTWAMISEPLREFSWWPDRCLIWETRRPYLYIRTTADGRVIAGGEDEPWSSAHESIGLMKKKVMRLTRKFRALFPGVEIEPAYAWAGIFGTTPDGLPYIGTLPEYPHTYFALGYGGNGITFGMIAADLIRDWWAGTPSVGQTLFGFDRLSRGA
jgi:glycine/D-amino acid oxidase-like deaminating enzyme